VLTRPSLPSSPRRSASRPARPKPPRSPRRRESAGRTAGYRGPALRASPYSEVTDQICRLPLHTLSCYTRGCSPWRPDAVIGTDGRATILSLDFSRVIPSAPDTQKNRVLVPSASVPISGWTTSGDTQDCQEEKKTPPGARADVIEIVCVAAPCPRPGSRILTGFPFEQAERR
jgi:hypothetical protein